MKHTVLLTDAELLLLDGQGSAHVQALIDNVRERMSMESRLGIGEHDAELILGLLTECETHKKLIFRHEQIRRCGVCGTAAGYAKVSRASKYKRKGDIDYDRPLSLPGIELADRSVIIRGSVERGCCKACFDRLLPIIRSELDGVEAQIPEQISGKPAVFRRFPVERCECGWMGSADEMGTKPTMMGDGYYPGACPQCGTEQTVMGRRVFERTGEWVVRRVEELSPRHQKMWF